MINMDAPKHTKLRLIVNRGFTPRQVAKIEENVRQQAREIVDHVATLGGECDFVSEIAAALPLADHLRHARHPAHRDEAHLRAHQHRSSASATPSTCRRSKSSWARAWSCSSTASTLAQDRLDNPRDDITTTLMQAEVEDENGKHKLTPGELGSFFLLLVVAGNETTRNAISHGMLALTQHPDQRAIWTADLEGVSATAVEEIVRWATPVIHFRRTAVADAVVGGQEIKAGEKVVMFYNSANRDERVFADPFQFDVTAHAQRARRLRRGRPALLPRRQPRPARDQDHVRGAVPPAARHRDHRRARLAPERFIHGIKRMPCTWHTVRD